VRRMEGNELHPWRDLNGVHLFDPVEVAEVARELRANGHRDRRYDRQLPGFILLRRLRDAEASLANVSPEPPERLLTEALDLLGVLFDYVPPGRAGRAIGEELESFLDRVGRHLRG